MPPRPPRRSSRCPAYELFDLLQGKWTLPVLYELHQARRALRFGELRKAVGSVTPAELTKTVRRLERLGLVTRTVHPSVPIRVEYGCTALGRSLEPALEALTDWLLHHRARLAAAA